MTQNTFSRADFTCLTTVLFGHVLLAHDRIVVSKDEDFLYLTNQPGDAGRLLWVRLGNCRNDALLMAFAKSFNTILAAFQSGQSVVELV
jgi:predicted nuclease of predicted toxin-antitoxin system